MAKGDSAFKIVRDPELDYIRVRASEYDSCRFRRHTHETYSIGLVQAGATTLEWRLGTMELAAGDLVFIHPEEVHACNPHPGNAWRYRMFYIDARWMEGLASAMGFLPPGTHHMNCRFPIRFVMRAS